MAQATPILRTDRGRVLAAAWVLLCLFAVVQIGLLARALWLAAGPPETAAVAPVTETVADPVVEIRPKLVAAPVAASPTAPAASALPSEPAAAPAPSKKNWMTPPAPGQLASPSAPQVTSGGLGPPPVGSLTLPSAPAAFNPPLVSPSAPVTAAPASPEPVATAPLRPTPSAPADPAANMTLEALLDLAKQVRGLGDMQGALEVLRQADLRFPARPEVLTELARCYEQMGLNEKAAAYWRQLSAQNPNRADGFRDLAQRRLSTAAGLPAAESGRVLALGACRAQRDAAAANGEKVLLRIPILRQGTAQVDPAQVDIDVYFFDRVNGQQVALTIADEPPSAWMAPPVDWRGIGEEPLDVTYFLPTLTPGEVAAHGRRAYHGYVVRLYYQNKLQDVAAEPRDLLDFGLPTPRPEAGAEHPFLPPVSR